MRARSRRITSFPPVPEKDGHLLIGGSRLSVGAIGIFEGFFGISNRLPPGVLAAWVHPAIYLLLGAVTLFAGISIRIRVRDEAH